MSSFKKIGDRMIVTIVTVILIIVISVTSGGRDKITYAENIIGRIITPIQRIFYNAGEYVSGTFNSIASISHLKEENMNLKKEIAKLKRENISYESLISRTEFLRNEWILQNNSKFTLVKAEIIGKNSGNWFDRFVINKGLKDGVKKGDAIIQGINVEGDIIEEGLVGRIVDVGDTWAKVVSIVDEGSNVSFKVVRTQDGGVLSGSVNGKLSGYLFDSKADVVKGDKLVTSGLGGVFCKEIYIGEIDEVTKKSEDLMKKVEIKPALNFKKLDNVFVVIENKETRE